MLASFDASELTKSLKQAAMQLGFSRVGVCPAGPHPQFERFRAWLAAGYAGEMSYFERRQEAYCHPSHVLAGVNSLVVLAFDYATVPPRPPMTDPPSGRVARYAWGMVDYHDLLHERLRALADQFRTWVPHAAVRGVVDTAPLPEREFARMAGLGWIGKNTLLIHPQSGSWCFLAVLLTDQILHYDQPFAVDHCGSCRACLDACPTNAFPQPYVLDARRCISYLTIELRGPVPEELRTQLQSWIFGCDICQEVCPWNRFAVPTDELGLFPQAHTDPLPLRQVFYWNEATFRRAFRTTALWRAKRRGLLRNAALLLGTRKDWAGAQALIYGLRDAEPLVRGACVWALSNLRSASQVDASLRRHAQRERHPDVRRELARALATSNY